MRGGKRLVFRLSCLAWILNCYAKKEKDFWRSSLLLTSFQQEERKQGDAELQLGIKAHDVLWNQLIKTAYKLFWSFSNIIADYLRKNVVPLRFYPEKTRLLVVEMSHDDVYSCFFLSFLANYRSELNAISDRQEGA